MDGVTIINTYKSLSDGSAAILAFGICFLVILIVSGLVCLHECYDRKDKACGIALLASAFGIALVLVFVIKPEQYYEVVLDEGVKWQEFTTHYEIEKVRGQILTVREVKDDRP